MNDSSLDSLQTLSFHSKNIHEIMAYGEDVPKRIFDRYRILFEQHEKDAFVLALIGALIISDGRRKTQ